MKPFCFAICFFTALFMVGCSNGEGASKGAGDSTVLDIKVEPQLADHRAFSGKKCLAFTMKAYRLVIDDVVKNHAPRSQDVLFCFLSRQDANLVLAYTDAGQYREAYQVMVTANPNEKLLLTYLRDALEDAIVDRFISAPNRQGRTIGWAWGRNADAAAEAYAHTRNIKFAELILSDCPTLIALTDKALGRVDEIRGEPTESWGGMVRMVEGKNEPRAYTVEIATAGVTFSPCVKIAALLKKDPELAKLYAPFITEILNHAEKQYELMLPLVVEHPSTGAITFLSGTKTWNEALNHTGVWFELVAYLYEGTGKEKYKDHLQGMLRFMELCTIDLGGRAFVEYRATHDECVAYAQRDDLESIPGEHTFKGRQTILIPVRANEVGLNVDKEMAAKIGKSFREHAFKEEGEWCIRLNQGCGENAKQQRLDLAPGWILLDEFDPEMRSHIVRLVANNKNDAYKYGWFTNRTTVRAYAHLFKDISNEQSLGAIRKEFLAGNPPRSKPKSKAKAKSQRR